MSALTVAGVVLGTPAFLAPELMSSQTPFDGRADLYALACVAFWMLTGRPPFLATDAMALLMQHSNEDPAPPSAFSELPIPPELDALILQCLSKEPAKRPATADAVAQRLDTLGIAAKWDARHARTWWELHEPELSEHA